MTEAEWLACSEPQRMLDRLQNASERKLRLFACACCRCIWHLLSEGDRQAVKVAEQFSEGLATSVERDAARYARSQAQPGRLPAPSRAAGAATFASGWSAACHVAAHSAETGLDGGIQSALLRDIFGNPFRPAPLDPAWRTETAVALAKQMYESRDFSAMPILADALQDAECDNEDILAHCRGPGPLGGRGALPPCNPHVRGCWVVDLVLDKE